MIRCRARAETRRRGGVGRTRHLRLALDRSEASEWSRRSRTHRGPEALVHGAGRCMHRGSLTRARIDSSRSRVPAGIASRDLPRDHRDQQHRGRDRFRGRARHTAGAAFPGHTGHTARSRRERQGDARAVTRRPTRIARGLPERTSRCSVHGPGIASIADDVVGATWRARAAYEYKLPPRPDAGGYCSTSNRATRPAGSAPALFGATSY